MPKRREDPENPQNPRNSFFDWFLLEVWGFGRRRRGSQLPPPATGETTRLNRRGYPSDKDPYETKKLILGPKSVHDIVSAILGFFRGIIDRRRE